MFQSAVPRKEFLHNSVAGLISSVYHICGGQNENLVKVEYIKGILSRRGRRGKQKWMVKKGLVSPSCHYIVQHGS